METVPAACNCRQCAGLRGGSTDIKRAGNDRKIIAKQGGWVENSAAVEGYSEDGDGWEENALVKAPQNGRRRRYPVVELSIRTPGEGTAMNQDGLEFPATFDQEFVRQDGQRGYFGRNVLKGLVDGMKGFLEEKRRTPGFRSLGPVALGGFLWLDDPELTACLAGFAHTCVVVSKQGRSKRDLEKLGRLQPFADGDNGMLARVFAELTDLDRRENGRAKVVGPGSSMPDDVVIPPLRTIGFRRPPKKDMVPFLHTKIMLFGEMWWHDEDGLGGVADVIGFRPERLWVGSANATERSRYNLEFGMWLDDPQALQAAQTFLVQLMAHSEALDPDSDLFEPELLPVDFDDEAFAEYAAEYEWGDPDV